MILNWLKYRLPTETTNPRHLIVTKCSVKSSTGSAKTTFNVRKEKTLRA